MKTIHILEGCIFCAALLLATSSSCRANSTQLSFNLTANSSPNEDSGGSGGATFVNGNLFVDVSFASGSVTSTDVTCFDFGCVPTDITYGPEGQIDIDVFVGDQLSAQFVGTFLSGEESLSYFDANDVLGDNFGGTFTLNGFAGMGQIGIIHTNAGSGEIDFATLTYSGTATPEPGTLALLCTGLLAMGPMVRRHFGRV